MHLTCPSDSSATYLLSFLALSGYIHFFAQGDVCSCQTYGGCNACLSPDACTIINVALGKPTNISSLYSNGGYNQVSGPPCLAVNGNTGSTFKPINTNSDSPACVHTADGDLFPFWEVDLGQQHVITNVTVYGRDEIDRNMLRNAKVTVDNKLCYTFAPDYHRPIATEITCNPPLFGRKVRIQKDNDTSLPFLALCQVQVWVCNNNYYGLDCTNTCGNCSGGTCQPWSGECPRGCSAGYQAPYCKATCGGGSYGNGCKETCGRCQAKGACSIYDGRCNTGCEAGYQPPLCKEICTNDSYGLNCSNTCGNCSEGTSCNPVSGECPLGCNPGYQGTHCNDTCSAGVYGNGCIHICGNCLHSSPCNVYNGRCDNGCAAGYKMPFCTVECQSQTDEDCVSEPTDNTRVIDEVYTTEKACTCAADTSSGGATWGGPVAGAVVGSFASCAIAFLLGVVVMRYLQRRQHKRQSFLPSHLQTVNNPSLAEVSRTDLTASTDDSRVNSNVYEVLDVSGCMNISSDVSSSPYVNIK